VRTGEVKAMASHSTEALRCFQEGQSFEECQDYLNAMKQFRAALAQEWREEYHLALVRVLVKMDLLVAARKELAQVELKGPYRDLAEQFVAACRRCGAEQMALETQQRLRKPSPVQLSRQVRKLD